MNINDFPVFFRKIHNSDPFPWQKRLLSVVERERWPERIVLPTSSGKTSVIDISLFSMALHILSGKQPLRRIYFTVDRRFVVDEAYNTAMAIRDALISSLDADGVVGDVARALVSAAGHKESSPVEVVRMHGGIPHEPVFIKNPLQPTVILSTVDQVGSRLLFRGYGISEYMRPVHAALVAKDSLIILDEAHLSTPFLNTLKMIERYQGSNWSERQVGRNATFVSMSATHPELSGSVFGLDDEDFNDPVLSKRLLVHKPVKLREVRVERESDNEERLINLSLEFSQEALTAIRGKSTPRVSIVVNSVSLANSIYDDLAKHSEIDTVKIIGRVRPYDRDSILETVLPELTVGKEDTNRTKPLMVVSTQTIEVGANLDFDIMISEIAPLNSLQQRFGRLNRVGVRSGSFGEILFSPDRADVNTVIYGDAWKNTWLWLKKIQHNGEVDFGPKWMGSATANEDVSELSVEAQKAPIIMPPHMDLLAQTSPDPEFEPDLPLLLHGTAESSPDVQVVWRSDLPEDMVSLGEINVREIISLLPPSSYEAAPLPIWAIKSLLDGTISDFPDTEGSRPLVESDRARSRLRKAFIWKGMQGGYIANVDEIKPGDTVILPSTYGGYDSFGWNPSSQYPVADVAEVATERVFGRKVFRLHPGMIPIWFSDASSDHADKCKEIIEAVIIGFTSGDDLYDLVDQALINISDMPGIKSEVSKTMRGLIAMGRKRNQRVYPIDSPKGVLLETSLMSPEESTDEDDSSSYTDDVSLEKHSKGVQNHVRQFASSLGLPDDIVSNLSMAGLLHDLGKADPRFQSWLRGGLPFTESTPLLAKSHGPGNDLRSIAKARETAGYPKGGRHECYSYALIRTNPKLLGDGVNDPDLVSYIVGVHHGRGRPLMPVIEDPGTSIQFDFFGQSVTFEGNHGLEMLDSEWPSLFWNLVRKYGYWGLPYMEMIVRLGDHRESEEEAMNREK
ncbi:MAG: type I-U CRISPR-associated helicase/endonuclease Cas3 [Candidatus Thermoplasmatota archaeon]|nr:type I-U CRISPR-associated helicase/endonuclease Cas3 [Candidatus Thermoplasmatota archaeon]